MYIHKYSDHEKQTEHLIAMGAGIGYYTERDAFGNQGMLQFMPNYTVNGAIYDRNGRHVLYLRPDEVLEQSIDLDADASVLDYAVETMRLLGFDDWEAPDLLRAAVNRPFETFAHHHYTFSGYKKLLSIGNVEAVPIGRGYIAYNTMNGEAFGQVYITTAAIGHGGVGLYEYKGINKNAPDIWTGRTQYRDSSGMDVRKAVIGAPSTDFAIEAFKHIAPGEAMEMKRRSYKNALFER